MRFKTMLAIPLFASTMLVAIPAAAQDQEDAEAAQMMEVLPGATTYQGSVQPCGTGGAHRVRMEANQRYTILASSGSFDSYLRVMRSGSPDVLAEDDDSGGGLNARLTYAPAESGEYLVCVTSLSPTGSGDYRLQVAPAGPLPALISRASRTERVQARIYDGSLAADDPADGSRRFDDYELRLAAGQAAMISLDGMGQFDPLLKIYSLSRRGGQVLVENDDAGGTTNSFIAFTPDEAGTYVVRVTSYGENMTGNYRLRVIAQP